MNLHVCADNVEAGGNSPAKRMLEAECKKGEVVRYLGPMGYRSPLGNEFCLNAYAIVRLPVEGHVPNVMGSR